jgi:hypothetical protein
MKSNLLQAVTYNCCQLMQLYRRNRGKFSEKKKEGNGKNIKSEDKFYLIYIASKLCPQRSF